MKATKNSSTITAFSRYAKAFFKASRIKYIERNPKIAKIIQEYTMNGSLDTAITAGTESKANITSDVSTIAKHKNKGVA